MKFLFNLKARLNPTYTLQRELTKPHFAVPDLDSVDFALSQGVQVNAKDAKDKTMLVNCIESYVRLLEEEKTIPLRQAIEGQGNLPLGHFAKQAETFAIAAGKLLAAGADPRIGNPSALAILGPHIHEEGAGRLFAVMKSSAERHNAVDIALSGQNFKLNS